ncbi:MAG: hypothetical protein J6330_11670 [Clostridia bacterium]|nr:hypothetical protein [Clostridia bacterium]
MNTPLNIDVVQILLHVLNLVILVGGLSLILYKPIVRFLKQRREYYDGLEKKHAEYEKEYEKFESEKQQLLADAEAEAQQRRQQAERQIAEMTKRYADEAKTRADAVIRAAEDEAEARKRSILESAQTEIGELVLSATQKLLQDGANEKTDSALYDEFIRTANTADGKKKK